MQNTGPTCILFDPSLPDIVIKFTEYESSAWKDLYEVEDEPIPTDMPIPRSKHMSVVCFVDASHADLFTNYRQRDTFDFTYFESMGWIC